MVRKLALAAALAATLASPPLLDTLWSWAASLAQGDPLPLPDTPQPTSDDDKGYSIDPDG